MARTYKLDDGSGLDDLRAMMRRKAAGVKKRTALWCHGRLSNFDYHVFRDGEGTGWSYYFAANWNISAGSPDISVIEPPRRYIEDKDKYIADWRESLAGAPEIVAAADDSDPIYVVNNAWYGKALNEGGLRRKFGKRTVVGKPLRFMEACQDELGAAIRDAIRQAAKED